MELNIWDIIAREITGELTDTERVELDRWLEESQENREAYDEARESWDFSASVTPGFEPNVDQAWDRVKAHIDADENVVPINKNYSKRNKFILSIAAALIIGLVSVMTFRLMDTEEISEGTTYASVTSDADAQEVILPDGSTVWLNANSTLEWASEFKGDKRRVRLTGEAFFEVTKNPDKPFVIETPTTRTTVLGTSFLLREDADGSDRVLVVSTGKVAFSKKDTEAGALTLEAGDRGSFEGDNLVKSENDDPNAFAFKTRELVLQDISMEQGAYAIGNYFGVDVEVDDAVKGMTLKSGTAQEPQLEVLLNQISAAHQIDASYSDGKVVLKPL